MRAGTSGRGANLCNQMLDLAFGPMDRARQERFDVLLAKMRRQLGDRAQVKATVGQHAEDDGEAP